MDPSATPRINHACIQAFVGRTVRVVGQVTSAPAGGRAVLQSSDGKPLTVYTREESASEWTDRFVEVIAKVNGDYTLQEVYSTNFGNNFGTFALGSSDLRPHSSFVLLYRSEHPQRFSHSLPRSQRDVLIAYTLVLSGLVTFYDNG